MAMQVTFKLERETKNTVRFEELLKTGEPPKIGTIYVQKWALGELDPAKGLRVTIEEA
jgi:hypothetical protein